MVSIEEEFNDRMKRDILKAERKAEMEMFRKESIYEHTHNKSVEKSIHSEEMEMHIKELIKTFQKIEKTRIEKKFEKLERTVDTLSISSEEDIKIIKDI